jgi:hypothetical protein
MTPKEKAKELYEKYEFVYIQNYTSKHEVKQCALIAVDEILDDDVYDMSEQLFDRRIEYWKEVKFEIMKL